MIPGICLALGVTARGIFVVPAGLIAGVALGSRSRAVDSLGGLAGVGVIVVWIGSINLDYQHCRSHTAHLSLAPGGPTSASFSSGGVNGLPWMILSASAMAVAIVLYLLMTRPKVSGDGSAAAVSLPGH